MQTLRVGVASDPPFNVGGAGLDIDLMTALAAVIGEQVEFSPCTDWASPEALFDRLAAGEYHCVAAGATVTPERARKVAFLPPYVISGQALAVDTTRLPQVRSIGDLGGRTIGVQRGDTSQPIAERLVAEGRAGQVRVYDYGALSAAFADLTNGGCDAVMKLAPVLTALASTVAGVEVVQRGLSTEEIAVAVNAADQALLGRLQVAQAEVEEDGTLQRFRRRWLGNPFVDQSLAVR